MAVHGVTNLAGEMHYNMTGWTFTSGPFAGQPRLGMTTWVRAHPADSHATTTVPLNTRAFVSRADAPRNFWTLSSFYAFRSVHTGGANFVFGDGAVRFIQETIAFSAYQWLGSRNSDLPPRRIISHDFDKFWNKKIAYTSESLSKVWNFPMLGLNAV